MSREIFRSGARLTTAIAAYAALVLALTSCSGGSASALRGVLRIGVQDASSSLSGYLDDITVFARKSAIEVPAELDDAMRQADDAVRSGAQLTDEERTLLASGERWVSFYKELDAVLQLAIGWEISISDDAIRLVNARMRTQPTPEFRAVVDALEQKVLKGLMCQAARQGLDGAAEAQAESMTPVYDSFGMEHSDVELYIADAIAGWQGAYEVLDYAGLTTASIDLHNSYVEGVLDVIESPDGSFAAANLIYFRTCVVTK
ncbi:hypothetical protein [Microbacterium sp. EST19A]|uniref:hypothetical protein n=1 Tax=Microbacterium sp. EST19A TaxID=2862681 RepID=UPI001CBD9708|nr:hypothetical protein [Microbacterium sp. EST19A]